MTSAPWGEVWQRTSGRWRTCDATRWRYQDIQTGTADVEAQIKNRIGEAQNLGIQNLFNVVLRDRDIGRVGTRRIEQKLLLG